MREIHVLDSETINRIAAGEVVERPASVIKELVENAIDAGATSITVEIKDGGISFMRITDNGHGIEKSQIRTAFLRHATSKIDCAEDLSHISSLGFRGEALSSICAVSQVELITKTKDSLTGVHVTMEGEKELSFEEIGAPNGTTFLIRNLFFNTPARKKFLKSPVTEGGAITDLMEHLALSRPDISMKYIMGNQTKFFTSGNGDIKEVIFRIYGKDFVKNLVPFKVDGNLIRVSGYLGTPSVVRSNRNFEIFFLNGRYIKSIILSKAVEEGFRQYLMQHKFPLCFLNIELDDLGLVDVNVHPSKMEVRFQDEPYIFKLLSESISHKLMNKEMIPSVSFEGEKKAASEKLPVQTQIPVNVILPAGKNETKVEQVTFIPDTKPDNQSEKLSAKSDAPLYENIISTSNFDDVIDKEQSQSELKVADTRMDYHSNTNSQEKPAVLKAPEPFETAHRSEYLAKQEQIFAKEKESIEKYEQENLFEEKILTPENRKDFRIIGQVFDTYWMIEYEQKLLIIDQHAAHEKVKYERFMKQYHEKNIVSQNLMPGIVLTFNGMEERTYLEYTEVFKNLGFDIDHFGGKEYTIHAVPVDLYGHNEKELFLEVLDELADLGKKGDLRVITDKIASMSCKAAVKGNNVLSLEEAHKLIDELLQLDNPYNCPHGRPTIVSVSKYEMEKKFKR